MFLLADQGSGFIRFHPDKDHDFGEKCFTEDTQAIKPGDYVLVINSYDEDRDDWEEQEWGEPNDVFRVYSSLQEAQDVLNKHEENVETEGIDIYDFNAIVASDIWWYA